MCYSSVSESRKSVFPKLLWFSDGNSLGLCWQLFFTTIVHVSTISLLITSVSVGGSHLFDLLSWLNAASSSPIVTLAATVLGDAQLLFFVVPFVDRLLLFLPSLFVLL